MALIWNATNAHDGSSAAQLRRRAESAGGWSSLLSEEGMIVLGQQERPRSFRAYELPNGMGIVLGRLFPGQLADLNDRWEPMFTNHDAMEFLRTGGRRFIEKYWGGYVAFIRQPDGTRACVIRDVSARIPCYRTSSDRINIIFSDIHDLACLLLPEFRINYSYIAAFILYSQLQIRDCGLHDVYELLAGDSWEMQGGTMRQTAAWDPIRTCEDGVLEDYAAATEQLRSTAQHCIGAWASVHDNILLSLSGGLDSAIVLGCLSKAQRRPNITCLNVFSSNAGDDERRYAQGAATRAKVGLISLRRASAKGIFDSRSLQAPRAPKPTIPLYFNLRQTELINRVARESNADSMWTGQGGDHIFYQLHTSLGAADYVTRRGLDWGLVAVIRDSARLSRKPYFSVAREAWRLRGLQAPLDAANLLEREEYFVNPDLRSGARVYLTHPWMHAASRVPIGKQLQVYFLSEVLHRHRPVPEIEYAYEHHPLLSQPLVELCLRLPTYLLLHGGRDRGLARDAFVDCVPEEIINRSDKGSTTTYVIEAIRSNEQFIREILLDGILVDLGIVSRRSLEGVLVSRNPLQPKQTMPLLACISAELWLRSWRKTVNTAPLRSS